MKCDEKDEEGRRQVGSQGRSKESGAGSLEKVRHKQNLRV